MNIKGEDDLWEYLLKEIRKMFPDKDIPEPLFWKAHPWTSGCTYWLPGNYDPHEMSKEALHPYPETMPGVHWCGESFSLRQAWMEGALEHADALLEKYF
jgi:monoamine oxidase